jgi:hypothetical protein
MENLRLVETVLQDVFDNVVDILPQEFKEEFKNKAFISGGCISA